MASDGNSDGIEVLPFYVVCDESSSMAGDSIDAVNVGIAELFRTIAGDPIFDEKAWVGIIAFNDQARELTPLTKFSNLSTVPGCVASGSTSYAAVFELLRTTIETDIKRLNEVEGYCARRPMVFFMSDGEPNAEDWRTPLAALTDQGFAFRPTIVGFGVAGAQSAVIKEVSTRISTDGSKTSFAFLAQAGVNPGDALKEVLKPLIFS